MSPLRLLTLKVIWEALDHCAPGYEARKSLHHWRVTYQGRTFPTLPLGKHGRRENPEIEVGHVRKMARFLDIEECMFRTLDI